MPETGQDTPKTSKKQIVQRAVIQEKDRILSVYPNADEGLVNKSARDKVAAKIRIQRLKKEVRFAYIDALTGLHNRRWFKDELDRRLKEVRRTKSPLYLVSIDVDNLKTINSTFGYEGGDAALKLLASLPSREDESIARVGGDEFKQLLDRDLTPQQVGQILRRYRQKIDELGKVLFEKAPVTEGADPESALRKVSVSFGVAKYEGESAEEFTKKADSALMFTKRNEKDAAYLVDTQGGKVQFTRI